MCGRFTLRRDIHSIARELKVGAIGGSVIHEPRYNIAPTQQAPILTADLERGRQIHPMVWGIPRSRNGRAGTANQRSRRGASSSQFTLRRHHRWLLRVDRR
jgi:putative SOS response-associated peptidase YedK